MHNFDDLQKRCKKHNLIKTFKYIFTLGILLFSILAAYFYIQKGKSPLQTKTTTTHTIKKVKPKTEHKKVQKPLEKKIKKSKKVKSISKKSRQKKYSLQFLVIKKENILRAKKRKKQLEYLGFQNCKLTPHGRFIYLTCNESNSIQELSKYIKLAKSKKINYYIDTCYNNIHKEIKKETHNKQPLKKKIEQPIKQIKKVVAPMLKVQDINIKELQNRFSHAPSYAIALVIARNYYTKKIYKNAIIWAKKANQLNKSDAESWLIYAKSLHALKQYKQAKQLLHIYLQYENSDEVKKLLEQWEKRQ